MNESHENGHADHNIAIPGGPGQTPIHFAPEEWQSFRKGDVGAGKAVVLLMGGIFAVGVLLYLTVNYICFYRVM